MTDNVFPFAPRPPANPEDTPHAAGKARCLDCKHEWAGVAPAGVRWLECPACTLVRGRFIYWHLREGLGWQCNCGNDLFHATPEGVYCPNCRTWQQFPRTPC